LTIAGKTLSFYDLSDFQTTQILILTKPYLILFCSYNQIYYDFNILQTKVDLITKQS